MTKSWDELIEEAIWRNVSAVVDGSVLWICGCVTELVNGDQPGGFRHVNKSCEEHKELWPQFGITFDE